MECTAILSHCRQNELAVRLQLSGGVLECTAILSHCRQQELTVCVQLSRNRSLNTLLHVAAIDGHVAPRYVEQRREQWREQWRHVNSDEHLGRWHAARQWYEAAPGERQSGTPARALLARIWGI